MRPGITFTAPHIVAFALLLEEVLGILVGILDDTTDAVAVDVRQKKTKPAFGHLESESECYKHKGHKGRYYQSVMNGHNALARHSIVSRPDAVALV